MSHRAVAYYCIWMLIFLIGKPSLYAQMDSILITRLSEDDGLSGDNINDLLQDHRGFIWIGGNGLSRYDGLTFKTYYADPDDTTTLSRDRIWALYEDRQGMLWIGTDGGGLNRFDPATETFTRYPPDQNNPESISGKHVGAMYEDRQGNFWVGGDEGINLMDRAKGTFAHWKPFPDTLITAVQQRSNLILQIIEDDANDSILWLGSRNGLYSFNKVTKHFEYRSPGDKNRFHHSIREVYQHKPDSLWITTWGNGLMLYNKKKNLWKTFRYHRSATFNNSNVVWGVEQKSDQELWVATLDRGLGIFNMTNHQFSFFEKPATESYSGPEGARTILKDKSGILWVATQNGLLKIDPRTQLFRHFQLSTRFREYFFSMRAFAAVQAAGEDLLYIGSAAGDGLYAMDRHTNVISAIPYPDDRGQVQRLDIKDILYSKTGVLWVAADNGLYFLNKTSGILELFQQPASDPFILSGKYIYDIIEDHEGNIWLSVWKHGIVKVDIITRKLTLYSDFTDDLCYHPQNSMVGKNGNIWVSIDTRGVVMIEVESGNITRYDMVTNEKGDNYCCVSAIVQDDDGMVWVATTGRGLIRIDPTKPPGQKLKKLKMADGLPSLRISGMAKDKNGKLWLATNKGLTRLNTTTLEFRNFTRHEGLRIDKVNYHISSLETGEMFIGGYQGFSLFHPDSLENNPHKPPVVFKSFSVFDKEMQFDKNLNYIDHIELSYRQNFFSFSFAGLNYSFPERTQYAYKLEGFDKDWINNGTQRQANYTGVGPGTYTFRVKAANSDGVWNEEGISIGITITPPFWKTWWFYSLCVLATLGIIYLIFQYRIHQVKKREKLKADFEKQLATVRMTALNAQMNPHFLFNCLNSIKLYIIGSDLIAASDYLAKFARLIRMVLENSKFEKVVLSNELEALTLYIELEALRFEHRFVYKLDVDENMDTESIEIPPLILQPYIENAIWHGLMHKESKGTLGIRLWQENGYLHCVIEDNGIGRKKARELKSRSVTRHKSMGMKINTDRIAITNQLYNMKASVTITDLEDGKGEAAGTRVSLRIPV